MGVVARNGAGKLRHVRVGQFGIQQKKEEVQDLALDEFVEVIMPIVYLSMVLVGYYGPNAAILGNVGCEKWTWKKIPDLVKFLTALFRMFIIDVLAFMAA